MNLGHKLKEPILIALEDIRSQKLRSGLTILGVVIGVMSVVTVSAVIHGLNAHVAHRVEQLGSQVFFVSRFPAVRLGKIPEEIRTRKDLRIEDAQMITRRCPLIQIATPMRTRAIFFGLPNEVRYGGEQMRGAIVRGVEPEYQNVLEVVVLEDGRFFSGIDLEHRRNVCVIGQEVRRSLFPEIDPLGKELRLNGKNFEVIGILGEDKGFFGGPSLNDFVHIPLSTFEKVYPEIKETIIGVRIKNQNLLEASREEVVEVLRRQRGVPAEKPDDFEIFTPDLFSTLWNQLTGALVLLTFIISSLGLLVGGIGVMNVMLVSVTQRTREIGVRMAVGARRREILMQILCEAITLTGLGGVLGILGGALVSEIIRRLFPALPTSLSVFWVVIAFVVSVSVGLFFGLYPANRAARLDPVEALRHE